ncbi:hypothetical protein [Sphingobium fluviale]|uniref:Uncharacterized protein n=1 Tax=Sphingobium fluviale TaxID=2506423 RepID=A0A4Q1KLV4_9SPHN|nr:hypothetical protein [Sphingobium fluviale]RXR30848.1 hypothetical protein EQG66_00715 [Sphingobium fluviale]
MTTAVHASLKLARFLLKLLAALLVTLIGFILFLAILGLGGCQLLEWSAQSRTRDALPAQLEAGSFAYYKTCDPFFGGHAFAIEMAPEAAKRLRRGGMAFLTPHNSPSEPKKPIEWIASQTSSWNYDGGTPGMYCYDHFDHDGQDVLRHMFRKGGYYAQIGGSTYYLVPSLNLIVGGAPPGH